MDERLMSGDDRENLRNLIEGGRTDPNVLAYIVTKDNNTDGYHNYVYDKGDRNDTSTGCDL